MTQRDTNELTPEEKLQVEAQLERGNASKRARDVARIILANGSATTSDIEALGYKHSPRAVRDLRDAGITLITETEAYIDPDTGTQKRRGRYRIVGIDPNEQSRHAFSKKTIEAVKAPGRCEVCSAKGKLQVDHRVPFAIGGETYPHVLSELMPLCPSCNRAKSWTCEHCPNWQGKSVEFCKTCMWASPKSYKHIAEENARELRAVLYEENDIELFDKYRPNLVKVLHEWLHDKDARHED